MPDSTQVLTINSINIEGDDYQIEDTVARKRANEMALSIYEVGDLYFSMNTASPAARFGGEWEQLEDVFLRAANDTETGGSDTITLTVAQMPDHKHNVNSSLMAYSPGNGTGGVATGNSHSTVYALEKKGVDLAGTTSSGGGSAHSVMPHYQNVYVWQRVA